MRTWTIECAALALHGGCLLALYTNNDGAPLSKHVRDDYTHLLTLNDREVNKAEQGLLSDFQ